MSANKKNILLIVRWPVGGIRTFIRYVYRSFDSGLYHFTILGPDHPELDILNSELAGLDFDIVKLTSRPSCLELSYACLKLLVKRQYHLVHSHGFTSGLCAALPAYVMRKRHILTSHDVLSTAQFEGIKGRVKRSAMLVALSLIDTVHSVSHDAQTNLLEFFPGLEKKCVTIPNGIDCESFLNGKARDLRGELGLGEDDFLIGFLGRFMAQKGFAYLMDAVGLLSRNQNLARRPLVLCFGEGAFIREERQAISERGLEDYFRFLPFTTNVAGVLKGVDLVVMPSLWEACPLLAMETLVSGTPLLASDCVGLREVVRQTPTLVVPARDGGALADGIASCMENDLSVQFKKFVPEAACKFNVAVTVASLQSVLKEGMP